MVSLSKFILKKKNGKGGRIRRLAATKKILQIAWRGRQKETENSGEKQSVETDQPSKRNPMGILAKGKRVFSFI